MEKKIHLSSMTPVPHVGVDCCDCSTVPPFIYIDLPEGQRITMYFNSITGQWEPIPSHDTTDADIV